MSGQRTHFPSRLRIPEFDGLIVAARRKIVPIRAVSDAPFRGAMRAVEDFMAGSHIPEPYHRIIPTIFRRSDLLTIRAEGHAVGSVPVWQRVDQRGHSRCGERIEAP